MADTKLSALTDESIPTLDDWAYIVDNASPPVSYRIQLSRLLGNMFPSTCQGRLTLASGFPVFIPQPATPTSTNTGTDIVTWTADPGWPTGTIVTPLTTGGGLTIATRYFYGKLSSTTGAFYATAAAAFSAGAKVDLTANITQQILATGITNQTIYFSPYNGSLICLYDGTRWKIYAFTELSLALGTLTSALPYDAFLYDNSGVLTLELLAWTSDTVRATAIVQQDGIWCKSGALTRRLLGTIRTDSTTTTIDDAGGIASQVGGKRFVSNVYNQITSFMSEFDATDNWTYNTATIRQANGASGNKCEMVQSVPGGAIDAIYATTGRSSGSSVEALVGVGINSTTAFTGSWIGTVNNASGQAGMTARAVVALAVGYSYIAALESGNGSATSIFFGRRTAQPDTGSALTVSMQY